MHWNSYFTRLLTFAVLGVGRRRDGSQADEGCHKGQEEEGEMGAHDDEASRVGRAFAVSVTCGVVLGDIDKSSQKLMGRSPIVLRLRDGVRGKGGALMWRQPSAFCFFDMIRGVV